MRKRISLALVTALCTMSLAACGQDVSSNTAVDTAPATATEDTVLESSTLSNVISAEPTNPNDAAEEQQAENEKVAAGLIVQETADGSVAVILCDEKLDSIKDGESVLWLRLYYDDNRDGGYEISSSGSNWSMNRIGENGIAAEGTEFDKSGNQWKFVVAGDFVTDLEACTYYEAIFKDWNNDDNTKMFADGNFAVEKCEQIVVADNNDEQSEDTETIDQPESTGYWFLDTKLLDLDGGWIKLYDLDGSGMPTKLSYSKYGYDYDFSLKNVSISVTNG
ncbi:MAG: hypothetical protein K6F86_07775, partial [Lachnospiraceae bacterium]|nr:hypothetical protein [Lachnospiraceae bacterium]